MNTRNTSDAEIKTPKDHQPCNWHSLQAKKRLATKCVLAVLLGVAILIPAATNSQPLNDAVTAQLRSVPNSPGPPNAIPCGLLLGGDDPAVVLVGNLQAICTGQTVASGGPSSSGGGGAATATTLPGVVQERLEEARGKEEDPEPSAADSVLEVGRYGVFVSGEYENLNKDENKFEDGYNSIIRRLTLGGDVQITNRILAGLAFDTYSQDGRYDGPGNFEVDSYRFVGYGSFLPIGNLFVQVSANYGITSNERQRSATFIEPDSPSRTAAAGVVGTPHADFDADQYGAFVTTGYGFSFGPVTLTPRAGYEWQRIAFETYRESGNSGLELKFDSFDITSSLSTLGLLGSFAISTRYGVVIPQASFDWKHEFDRDQQDLDVSFIGDTRSKRFTYQNEEPDRNYYEINAGVVFVMPNGIQAFGNYRTITNNDIFDSDAVTLGLRYDF